MWKRQGWLRIEQIDVNTGLRDIDWDALNKERERIAQKGPLGRAMKLLF
jgi:amino acid transporter